MKNAEPVPDPVRGRYAPSPTGLLHLGNARTALAAWLSVRAQRGTFVWRLEDLDGPRTVPGMAEAALRDLAWLGLDWDEGPGWAEGGTGRDEGAGCNAGDVPQPFPLSTFPSSVPESGPHAPYHQSARGAIYEAALRQLAETGRLFPCRRSRRDLAGLASAPHGAEGLPPYPREWRPQALAADWFETEADCALRFRVSDGLVCFDDRVQGRVCEDVAAAVGDFVLRRRDGLYAYQLAVVVDDLAMGITEVVRGADLLDSTARQIQLIEALGGNPPAYAHVGLVVNEAGEKLSKRDAALSLAALREAGVAPEAVVGWLGWSLGLWEVPCPARALVERFAWKHVSPGTVVAPGDLPDRLCAAR
ncbi:MAG TPA: tRNA glutamyl-Q(34) synthetase GluQRS [Rhodothermales bacterium]|nr:tRNA glutamyl-Q(34) synthetase GluQRS [Rhodothermales bacterium]